MGDYDISHYVEEQIIALQVQVTELEGRVLVLEQEPMSLPPDEVQEVEEDVKYGQ